LVQEVHLREPFPVVAILPVEFEEPRFALREKRDSLRKEKIARIREQILQGTYQISATEVAKAILRNGTSQLRRKKKDE
jgi:anti-sigma-28 factor FlgM